MSRFIPLSILAAAFGLQMALCPLTSAQTPSTLPTQRTVPSALGATNAPAPVTLQNGQEPADDIRDIQGPIHIRSLWVIICGILVIIASALVISLLFYWIMTKTKKKRVLTLQEIALEQLAQARILIDENKPKDFSISVSDCIRSYIEKRFNERAAHRTTEEFLNDMLAKEGNELSAYNDLLADFLRYCDLAKFAQWSFSAAEMEEMITSAQRFIEETKPKDTKVKS